jgi:hypothetical protein
MVRSFDVHGGYYIINGQRRRTDKSYFDTLQTKNNMTLASYFDIRKEVNRDAFDEFEKTYDR